MYNFPNHIKGDTFKERRINLGFDITNAVIQMQFKVADVTYFEWSTIDETFIVENAAEGIILMTSAILDYAPVSYLYDLQVIDVDRNVTTYFNGSLLIVQDITS
jgi:phosphoribosyl-dephospho-CoA transferase